MAKGKIGKKIEDLKYAAINSWIYYNYYHGDIDENLVYVESVNGKDFSGNVFRIVEELTKGDYGKLKIVVYAKKEIQPMIRKLQKNYSLDIDKIVSSRIAGTRIMEKAKYIIDHGFPMIENFYSDSLADTPLALCAEKAYLVSNKATVVSDWPALDPETMKTVKKKIDTGWNIHLKE